MSGVHRQRRASLAALLGLAPLLGGCGALRAIGLLPSPPAPRADPPPPPDYPLALHLSAAAGINPDAAGRPSPLRVHVYVDERDPRLDERGFAAVFGAGPTGALRTDGASVEPLETLVISPGEDVALALSPPREALWVSVAAAYREPWSALWYATVRVDAASAPTVTATFADAAVRLAAERRP